MARQRCGDAERIGQNKSVVLFYDVQFSPFLRRDGKLRLEGAEKRRVVGETGIRADFRDCAFRRLGQERTRVKQPLHRNVAVQAVSGCRLEAAHQVIFAQIMYVLQMPLFIIVKVFLKVVR